MTDLADAMPGFAHCGQHLFADTPDGRAAARKKHAGSGCSVGCDCKAEIARMICDGPVSLHPCRRCLHCLGEPLDGKPCDCPECMVITCHDEVPV